MSDILQGLKKDAELRAITDTQVSPLWILLPVVAAGLGLAYTFIVTAAILNAFAGGANFTAGQLTPTLDYVAGGAIYVLAGLLVLDVLFLYVIYLLIRRRNQHFARQQRFFADLASALREAATRKGANVDIHLGAMEATVRQAQIEETEKSAVLWVVLLLIPVVDLIAGLYILYFLTTDYYKHERREDGLLADSSRAFSVLGSSFSFSRYDPVPHRSFALYLILAIVTFGIWSFYWEYVLIQDPNGHFRNHIQFENAMVDSVSLLLA